MRPMTPYFLALLALTVAVALIGLLPTNEADGAQPPAAAEKEAARTGAGPLPQDMTLSGAWKGGMDGRLVLLEPDGRFKVVAPGAEQMNGHYVVEDNRVTFSTDPRSTQCAGATGVYTVREIGADSARLDKVRDDCRPRARVFSAPLQRAPDYHEFLGSERIQ